jgi:hypothetical protein
MVGNGDDGFDLKKFSPVDSGPIVDARKKAVLLLEKVNTDGVKGLGLLKKEVESTKLYMTKDGLSTKELFELGAFSNDDTGVVYARTFPKPHAATRFFPATRKLNEQQLVTLHIHEALHRSLPANINQDEKIISDIAMAITAPEATRDGIESVMERYTMPSKQEIPLISMAARVERREPPKEYARVNNPSEFSFTYRSFKKAEQESTRFFSLPIQSAYHMSSHLYPFGGKFDVIGLGIDLSTYNREDGESNMGPLEISSRAILWTVREFDIGLFAKVSLNTLSDEELKNSFFGRDLFSMGINMKTQNEHFYVENKLGITLPSSVNEKIGTIEYEYKFGEVYDVSIEAGTKIGRVKIGGQTHLLLSENFEVDGGEFKYESGRNRIMTAGPVLAYASHQFELGMRGSFLLSSSKNTDLDFLGDLMNHGVGKGELRGYMSIFF